jgi:hypothetical protein
MICFSVVFLAGVAVCGTIGGGAVPVIYYSYVSTINGRKTYQGLETHMRLEPRPVVVVTVVDS